MARVGIWRVIDILDRYGIRASALLNSEAVLHYPQIIEAGRQRNWAWLAHGKTNSELHTAVAFDDERILLRNVIDTIAQATGKRPKG